MRSDSVYIFTIDLDALKRAGYSQEEIDSLRNSSPEALYDQLLSSDKARDLLKPSVNLRDRLKQRWGL